MYPYANIPPDNGDTIKTPIFWSDIPGVITIKYKKELLIYHELEYLEDFKNYAAPINEKLEKSFESTNAKIINDLNIYFKLTPDSFVLTTPKLEKTEEQMEHTIGKYFPQSEFISVIDLLHSVQRKTEFSRLVTQKQIQCLLKL